MSKETKPAKAVSAVQVALMKILGFMQNMMKRLFTRSSAANLLMIAFIIMTSIGAWQIYPPMGFIVAGVGCGILGFILGLD